MLPRWQSASKGQWRILLAACSTLFLFQGPLQTFGAIDQPGLQQPLAPLGTPRPDTARPPKSVDPKTYLLTVQLGGPEAIATPEVLKLAQRTLAKWLKSDSDDCKIIEAANITQCIDGAPVPAPSYQIFLPPNSGPSDLSPYLRRVWTSEATSTSPPPIAGGLQREANVVQLSIAGRRLQDDDAGDGLNKGEAPAPKGDCMPACEITLQVSFPVATDDAQWNSTLDFFSSGRFVAKMQTAGINLQHAQLLGFREPLPNALAPAPNSPARILPNETVHTFGPQPGSPQANTTALEFTLEIVGDDAEVTNDSLLGALYDMITRPSPQPGSAFLDSANTAITIIRRGPPRTVGVALGRRLTRALITLARSSRGRQLAQAFVGPPPLADPVNAQYNVSKPSLDVTFRLQAVPPQGPLAVKDVINNLVSDDVLLQGFQALNLSVYQVNLLSFNFQPAPLPSPLSAPPAPPPIIPLSDRKSSNSPRTTIIVVAVVPVSVLGIALGILALLWYRHQKAHNMRHLDLEANQKLKEISSDSSDSEAFNHSLRPSEVIRRMHSSKLSQSRLLDMPWSDWKIDPSEITVLTKPDGSEWLLGAGASGRVYKALRHGVQIVAVKMFKEEMTRGAITSLTSPQHAHQFRQEISILKSCHDKNIVQFLGACLTEGQTILVTEYLENGDLYKAINSQQGGRYHWYRMQQPDGRPVPNSGMARRVALDVARGLHFLHTKKIVHFDLKSANILLARDFTAKIADVGLARILHDDVLSMRREVGTFAWAAPEVLLGLRTTEAADIYSFGVLLHELSAIESPSGRQLRKLRVPEECPQEVNDLIFRCLDPQPHMRPSARDLVAVLGCLPALPPFPPRSSSKDFSAYARSNSFTRHSISTYFSVAKAAPPR